MNIQISEVDWSEQQEALSEIRRKVFIEEQHVPKDLEWDGLDIKCRHVLAYDRTFEKSVGTGRLVTDGQIGRMAILKEYRRYGIGHKILEKLIELAISDGHAKVYLHAQLYVVEFYQQANFNVCGEVFMDAGIPHVKMTLKL